MVLLLSFSGFQYYKYQRVHNVFDEIYYEESDYHNYTFLWKGRAFYKLKGLKIVDNDSQEISIHSIDYKSVDLPNTIHSLGYYFYFGFQEMTKVGIEMRLRLPNTETTKYRDNHKCRLPVRCKQSAIRTIYVVSR